MKIGIVSGCIREKPKGIIKRIKVYALEEDLFVAEIPYSAKETTEKRLKKAIKRACNMLKKQGVKRIILANELKGEAFEMGEVFYLFAHKAVLLTIERFNILKPINLYVKQKRADIKTEFIINSLIYDAGRIGILTDDYYEGKRLAEKIMSEYGAYAEVFPYDYLPNDGVTVSPDEAEIYAGKWKLENFTAEINCYGYNINSIELYEVKYGNFQEMLIKDCQCGKNKLTLLAK